VLAGVVALTVFAGHPETALKVLACGGLYGLARAAASARPFRVAAWVAFAYALGLLLSAVQVVPFAEYLQVSRTQAVRASITVNPYALPRRVAVGTIVPDFWGHPVSQDYVAQTNSVGAATNYAEQQTYPGVATWVLACVGLATGTTRRWRVWFFAIAALLSAALAFGTPSLIEPLTSLPVLRVTLLSRFALLMIASAIMLASMGLDALVRRADGSAPRLGAAGVAGAVATGVAIAAALWAFRGDLTAAHLLSKATVGGLFSAAVAALIGGLAYGCARGRVAGSAFGVAACVAITAELAGVCRRRTQLGGCHRRVPIDAGNRDGPARPRPVPRPRRLRRPAREHRDGLPALGPAWLRRHGAARVERSARREPGVQRLVSHADASRRLAPREPAEREVCVRPARPRPAGAAVHARLE
jgi:hypothetical protein